MTPKIAPAMAPFLAPEPRCVASVSRTLTLPSGPFSKMADSYVPIHFSRVGRLDGVEVDPCVVDVVVEACVHDDAAALCHVPSPSTVVGTCNRNDG